MNINVALYNTIPKKSKVSNYLKNFPKCKMIKHIIFYMFKRYDLSTNACNYNICLGPNILS